jgi:ABC-type multidrug transport system fused ATPase/permease subunit
MVCSDPSAAPSKLGDQHRCDDERALQRGVVGGGARRWLRSRTPCWRTGPPARTSASTSRPSRRKAILEPWSSRRGGTIHDNNQALEQLLQMLRDKAYDAEDVLDELDYFRLQDAIYGTSEAADKGCCRNLVLNTRHTAKAVVGKLLCSSATTTPGQEANAGAGCMRKLVSGACNTVRHVGKRPPCSSMPPVRHGHEMHETPNKLEFNRVDISKRMGLIVEQLKAMRKEVSEILKTLGSNQSAAPVIAHSRPNTISESIEPKLYGRDDILNNIVHSITQGEYCGKNLTVLSIVGHGGIGKTTLAQYIYQHQQVQTLALVGVDIWSGNVFLLILMWIR